MKLVLEHSTADYLMHHGVKGQKRGKRQWQNPDGSYTPEGYQHYKEMYGWGEKKKKEAKTKAETEASAEYHDKMAIGLAKTNLKLATAGAVGTTIAARTIPYLRDVANSKILSAAQLEASLPKGLIQVDTPEQIQYFAETAITKLETIPHLLSQANGLNSIAQAIETIGPSAAIALGAGIVGLAAVTAYYAIRGSMLKRKASKMSDEVKHSDKDVMMSDILDRLSSDEKYAIIYTIDWIMKHKRIPEFANGISQTE